MKQVQAAATDQPEAAWWMRLHRRLMPDYNRKAAVYWWVTVLVGAAILTHSLHVLTALPPADMLQIGVGIGIAMLAGMFPVRIPRAKNSFAAGEIFIFLLLLLHGPQAATLAAAGEGLIGSWRTSKRWTSRIASPAMGSIAMFICGSLLQAGIAQAHSIGVYGAAFLLLAAMLCAIVDFVLNTLLVSALPYLKRDQWPTPRELFGDFGWVGATFVGSASLACLLFLTFQQSGIGVLMAAAPIIALMLATLHYFFRQQEADEVTRRNVAEAAGREAELVARHVRELEVSERRFHRAFTHASIGMALLSFDGRVLQANPALRTLLGIQDAAPLEQALFADFVEASDAEVLNRQLLELYAQKVPSFAADLRLHPSDASEVWAAVHGSVFSEAESVAPCLILQVQDITARRRAETGLHHIAFHDSLTGLPNRRRFHDQLAQALEQVGDEPKRHFWLMFLDFDRFKLINDSLGHAVGDDFLIAVARRIQQQLRPHDIVARLGGDEFAILAEDVDCEQYATALADRLLQALRQPFQIAGTEINTSASIGITFSGLGYSTPQDMLRDADTAMYKAKANGKARYVVFDTALHTEVAHRVQLESELRRALAEGSLTVAYQPMFELATGRVIGFEALARWNHAELGAIGPATFIPIAEEAGLMAPLTDFMLSSACRQLRQWQQRGPHLADLKMHVNISGNDIAHPSLVARVKAAIAEAGVQARHITLELTENILMARLAAALPVLAQLRRLGVGLSVDDFGTGYTSLRHLSNLPVDSLKIDRVFVADLQRGSSDAEVVRAIIQLGKSLGKAIVAEGIETQEQVDQLREMGCGAGQGFHLSHPLWATQVDGFLVPVESADPLSRVHLGLMHDPAVKPVRLH